MPGFKQIFFGEDNRLFIVAKGLLVLGYVNIFSRDVIGFL